MPDTATRDGLRRLVPKGLAAQLILMIVLVLAGISIVFALFVILMGDKPHQDSSASIAFKHILAVQQLETTPAGSRAALVADYNRSDAELILALLDEEPAELQFANGLHKPRFWPFQPRELLNGIALVGAFPMFNEEGRPSYPVLVFKLSDGQLVQASLGGVDAKLHGRMPHHRPPHPHPDFGSPLFIPVLFALLTIGALSIWSVRTVIRPLSKLAKAATTFGQTSIDPVPLEETGPSEVRAAVAAFNRMQGRINEILHQRTRTLAAIGHDLKTPLTRLRLRLDLVEDENIRQRSLADLEHMESQLESALNYLRQGASAEPRVRIDLASLLTSLADQYEGTGIEFRLSLQRGVTIFGHYSEMVRAFSNLIDNARKYAGSTLEIRTLRSKGGFVVEFADHGPGIAEADRQRMLEPFERGDAARTMEHGQGFGLGLSTAMAIVESHDGELQLLETDGGGLTVRITLPARG